MINLQGLDLNLLRTLNVLLSDWHRDPAHRWLRQQIVSSLEGKPC